MSMRGAGNATLAAYVKSVRAFGSKLKGAAKGMLEASLAEAAKVPKPAPPAPAYAPAVGVAHSTTMQQTWGPTGRRFSFLAALGTFSSGAGDGMSLAGWLRPVERGAPS